MATAPVTSPVPSESRCPLCGRALSLWNRRTLYKWPVCRRCRNAFANRRQAAWIVDYLLYTLVIAGLVALGMWFGVRWPHYVVPILAAPFLFKDGFDGMSPGKWICGMQVVDTETYCGIGPGRSAIRNLPLLTPLLLHFWPNPAIGDVGEGLFVLMLLIVGSQLIRGRRLGDRWAGTKVLWRRYAHQAPFDLRGVACLSCGYDLTVNISGVCPECGRPVAEDQARMSKSG